MPDSAKAAQRAEFRKLVFYLINTMADQQEWRPDAKWIERALDGYEPIVDVAAVENELGPLLLHLQTSARRGGIGSHAARANADRVESALNFLRGKKK